jgi:hypothetical protein
MKTEEKGAIGTLVEMIGNIFIKLTPRIVVGGALAIWLFINRLDLKTPLIESGAFTEKSSTILLVSIGTLIIIIIWDIFFGYLKSLITSKQSKKHNLVDEGGHFHVQLHDSKG